MDVNKRMSSRDALKHKWMIEGAAEEITKIHAAKGDDTLRHGKELRRLLKVVQLGIRFMCRIKNMKQLKSYADRNELRKRPFRNREVTFYLKYSNFKDSTRSRVRSI